MREHTKEPWVIDTDTVSSYAAAIRVKWEGGQKTIAYVEGPGLSPGDDEKRSLGLANARRIVACVNACAGLSTEAIESGAVADLIRAAMAI